MSIIKCKFKVGLLIVWLVSLLLHAGSYAEAQTINLRRVTTTPEQSISLHPCISGDGRTLAFESSFDFINLRAAKSFQTVTATTESDATPRFFHVANARALAPTLSQDGRKLAFASKDDPLGSNSDGNSEIFYFDGQVLRQLTHTRPGSVANRVIDGSFDPSMSDDGKLLTFTSNRDLVTGSNADESFEVFVFNVDSLLFTQVTTASAEVVFEQARLSGDGQQLAFVRATVSLGVAVDETRQLNYQEYPSGTVLLTRSSNNLSLQSGRSISDSSSKIVFSETDKNGIGQVHLYDHRQRTTRQITQLANRKSTTSDVPLNPTISGDGTRVAFSTKRNIGSLKGDNSAEVYIYDIPAGELIIITAAPAQASAEVMMSLSDDGTRMAFNFSRLLTEESVSAPEFNDSSEIYLAQVAQSLRSSNGLLILNAASQLAAPQTTFAPGMIAVARGSKLAIDSQYAVAAFDNHQRAFPKELSGTTVRINNRLTEIYYASPTHVTFYIPPDESGGEHSVVITNADGYETSGMMMIEPSSSSPGVFTLSGDGVGAALSIENDGLGNLPGQKDLADNLWHQRTSFFGTGFGDVRAAGALILNGRRYTDNLLINAIEDLPGLEQITVQIPRELRGAGQVSLQLEVGNRLSNPVTIPVDSAQENEIVINEILFDPPEGIAGDANRDGTRSGTNDEFVELVNQSNADVSLSGWTISTRTLTQVREKVVHSFSADTELAQADALVIFGGGDFNETHPFFGGAQALKASSGGLSLNNANMSVLIRDGSGKLITEIIYGAGQVNEAVSNQSLTRSPDVTGAFTPHLSVGDRQQRFTPGRKSDGAFFKTRRGILTRVSLTSANQEIAVGQEISCFAQSYDQFDQPLPNTSFTLKTLNQEVATLASLQVDIASGSAIIILRGVSPGATEISVVAAENSSSRESEPLKLRITPPLVRIHAIKIEPSAITLNRGARKQINAAALDISGAIVSNTPLNYSSSDSAVAVVDQMGNMTGVNQGIATLHVTASDNYGAEVSSRIEVIVGFPVRIQEIFADVASDNSATKQIEGDANRDGKRDSGDEFVELVNYSSEAVDISGLIVTDATSDRFTFSSESVLQPLQSVVIFGGGNAPLHDPAFGGSIIRKASSLGLNDDGDRVSLKLNISGTPKIIETVSFGEAHGAAKAPKNESLALYESLFLPHSVIKEAWGRKFSPGTKTDGTPYGSPPLTKILMQPQVTSIDMGSGSVNLRATAYSMIDQREVEILQVSFAWETVDTGNQVLSSISGESVTISAALHGTIFVKARAGAQEAQAVVTVNPVVASIELSPASASIFVGDFQKFVAVARDNAGTILSGLKFEFLMNDSATPNLASIVSALNDTANVRADNAGTISLSASFTNPGNGQMIAGSAQLIINAATPAESPVAGQVIINEVVISSANSAGQIREDFVELFNKTDRPLDISGLSIWFRPAGTAAAASLPSSIVLPGSLGSKTTVIAPRSYYLIVNGAQTYGVNADADVSSEKFDLNNSSGGVKLTLGDLKLDGLAYQGGATAPSSAFREFGEGGVFKFTSGSTNNLLRVPNGSDTEDNSIDYQRHGTASAVSPKAPNASKP